MSADVRVKTVFALFLGLATSYFSEAADSVYVKSTHDVNRIGAFAQEVPIEIPPGTAGVQPKLSLVYNSQLTNGLFGKGWSLSGLSVINRCNATVTQDGYVAPVVMGIFDRYCLDGVKLIAVSGSYGADGTEYRTETESFSRVFSYGSAGNGPLYFIVKTRSGQTMQYGYTSDSRLVPPSTGPFNSMDPTVAIWGLNQVKDLQSNYYNITYTNDTSSNFFYPQRIDYTGNSTAGTSTYNSVVFTYESRPDTGIFYRGDRVMQNAKRVHQISTYVSSVGVLNYVFEYHLSGQSYVSLMTKISASSADGTKSLNPISFTWNEPNGSYASSSSVNLPIQTPSTAVSSTANYIGGSGAGNSGSGIYNLGTGQGWSQGDFNGDGITDFVQLIPGATSVPVCFSNYGGKAFSCTDYALPVQFANTSTSSFLIGDFDGDGLTDIAQVDSASNVMNIYYSTGDGHFTCVTKTMPGYTSGTYFVGDFDGNGMTDIIEVDQTGQNFKVCFSNGRSFDNSCSSLSPSIFSAAYTPTFIKSHFFVADFDGDGLSDFILVTDSGTANLCYSTGGGIFDCEAKTFYGVTMSTGGQSKWFVGDFNGDGIADFGLVTKAGFTGGGAWICSSVGRGVNPICNGTYMPVELNTDSSVRDIYIAADLNGDGRTDIITKSADGSHFQLCYSGSDGSMNCTNLSIPSVPFYLFGNFTGDGTASILYGDPTASSVQLSATLSVPPDVITSVNNGLGAITKISYSPLTNGSVYQKGFGATYPSRDIQNSIYVAASVQDPDGIGGNTETDFNYAGARTDLQGRGFLGFAKVTKQNSFTGQKSETDYNQTYPFIGYPSASYSWIYQNSFWNLASTNTYTYAFTSLGNPGSTLAFPYLQREEDKLYDFAHPLSLTPISRAVTENQYDIYGNLRSTSVITDDGYEKLSANTYNNSTGGPNDVWYLGQLATDQQTNTNPDGTSLTRFTQFTYSATFPNELLSEQLQPGQPDSLTKTYSYDTWGNRNSVTVSGSAMSPRRTTYIYGTLGQFPTAITNAYGQTETRTYDARFGTLTNLVDINGVSASWHFDVLGRKDSETRPDGVTTTIAYTPCSGSCSETYNVQAQTTGAPTVTTYFDVLDREFKKSTGGFNSSTVWHYKNYDFAGRLAAVSRRFYTGDTPHYTKYSYDNGSRPVLEASPDGSTKTWSYTGLSTTITNNNKQTRTETKNSLGQVIQTVDAANQTTQFAYDPFGNLRTTTDPRGNKIIVTYDVMGRKIGMVDPDTGTSTYTYNGAGDLLTQTDAKGQTLTMSYDNLGRMISRQASEFTSTWTYDTATHGLGKLASFTNSSGFTKSFAYDVYGRVSSEQTTADTTYAISTTYDSSGRVSQITYPTGFAVNYVYDANGYLKELDNASTSAMLWQRNSQSADNLPVQETFGNGVVSSDSYDSVTGRLNGISAQSGTVTLQNLTLAYDKLGNVTRRTDLMNPYTGANLAETYTYDNLNRLTSARTPNNLKDFGYDVLGNLISKTDVGDMRYGDGRSGRPLHAVMFTTGPTNFQFTYDADGNMTSGEGRTLTWTSFNKAANISNASNGLTFSYDPNFERYKEVETTCADYHGNTSSTCVKYLINPRQDLGIHFEKEINGSITTYRNFLYAGPGNVVGVYTSRSDGSTETRYFHKDHLGSVVLSTYDNGTVAERLSYDAFGKRRYVDGTDDPNDVLRSVVSHQGFTNQEMLDDGGLGLINMNGRVYDPLIGRFMSPDPFVQAPKNLQSLNRYSYLMNNPTSGIDPSGYWGFGFVGGIVSSIGNAIGDAAGAIGHAVGTAGSWIGANAGTIGLAVGVAVVSVATYGAADVALGSVLGGFGAAVIAGAASGAVAGALGSQLLGGGFSWQAVEMGALAGAVGAGVSNLASGFGAIARIGGSAIGGGLSSWTISVAQGDPSWRSFYQGAVVGALVGAVTVGLKYLDSQSETNLESESPDTSSDVDRRSGTKLNNFDRAPASTTDELIGAKADGNLLTVDPDLAAIKEKVGSFMTNTDYWCGVAEGCTALTPFFSFVPQAEPIGMACATGVGVCLYMGTH